MILTKEEILKLIEEKRLLLDPFDKESITPASIDLALGDKIRIFNSRNSKIDISEEIDYEKITKEVDITNGFELEPGELVLGITKEKITLPESVAGWLQSRSRFARIGLMSHITAPFIFPGVENHQVLEIFNSGHHPIILRPGVKICQLILEECKGETKYLGRFKDQ
ncbi:MAG: dCTP deaminase [archaeon]